jgi:NADPH:quinone reductase-like Zn-dependent oxidoreductase
MSESEFLQLQNILNDTAKILWVSSGDISGDGIGPESAMTLGFLRSLRSERASLNATCVDFVKTDLASEEFTSRTTSLAAALFGKGKKLETEYLARGGQLLLNRLIPAEKINETHGDTGWETRPQTFDLKSRLVGKIRSGKVVFETVPPDTQPLQQDEIEFQPLATGINREDQAVVSGVSFDTNFSHEASGTVTRVGSAVTRVSIGDSIIAFSLSKFSNYQRIPEYLAQRIESGEFCTTIASLPMYYGAALYGLQILASLQHQESVLILPGSGLPGAAAIRIVQALHGLPYVAVCDSNEAEHVAATFALSSDQILVNFIPQTLLDLEIDVVFSGNSVDPNLARESWRYTPAFSRFINCNATIQAASFDSAPTARGASYLSATLTSLHKKPRILATVLERIMTLYQEGAIPIPPLVVRNITELNESILSFTDTLRDNKIIITHHASGGTVDVIRSRPRLSLCTDATYLLVGCLGGLGRSLTSWMMKHGARNFAFLSRSGKDSPQAAILLKDLETRGANVQVFRGDAAVKEDVENAVRSVPIDRPIRGVVNAAMVLQVSGTLPNEKSKASTRSFMVCLVLLYFDANRYAGRSISQHDL